MKSNEYVVSYEEELILFYNKYLNIGLGEGYLYNLVNKLAELWKKENQVAIKNKNAKNFKSEAQPFLWKAEQDFFAFFPHPTLSINSDYKITLDAYGTITDFLFNHNLSDVEKEELSKNIGTNIFAFLQKLEPSLEQQDAIEAAENIILQNILASKIYKAMYEKLKKESELEANAFANEKAEIINFDETLKETFDYEESFKAKLAHSRSRR